MNKVYILGSFVSGIALGISCSYVIVKNRYDQRMKNEINSVKAAYKNRKDSLNQTVTENTENEPDISTDKVRKIIDENEYLSEDYQDYTSCFTDSKDSLDEFPEDSEEHIDLPNNDPYRPRMITDEEYYDEQDLDKVEICLFENDTDFVLTDSSWEPLEEPYRVITNSDLKEFISRPDIDEVFTICEARNCMYSISKQGQSWEEFLKNNPVIVETRR